MTASPCRREAILCGSIGSRASGDTRILAGTCADRQERKHLGRPGAPATRTAAGRELQRRYRRDAAAYSAARMPGAEARPSDDDAAQRGLNGTLGRDAARRCCCANEHEQTGGGEVVLCGGDLHSPTDRTRSGALGRLVQAQKPGTRIGVPGHGAQRRRKTWPNVRAELPAEADGAWPRRRKCHRPPERPSDGCRSGSARASG
jgi:hypothetical protein